MTEAVARLLDRLQAILTQDAAQLRNNEFGGLRETIAVKHKCLLEMSRLTPNDIVDAQGNPKVSEHINAIKLQITENKVLIESHLNAVRHVNVICCNIERRASSDTTYPPYRQRHRRS